MIKLISYFRQEIMEEIFFVGGLFHFCYCMYQSYNCFWTIYFDSILYSWMWLLKISRTSIKSYFLINLINIKNVSIDSQEVKWEIHDKETSLYWNTWDSVVCTEWLKSKVHYKHDTSGDIYEVKNY